MERDLGFRARLKVASHGLVSRRRCQGRSTALNGGFVDKEGGEREAHFGQGARGVRREP
jgi:hypothetical protein